jgi:hypothetical protein
MTAEEEEVIWSEVRGICWGGGMVLDLPSHISYCQMFYSRSHTPFVPNEEGLHPVGKQAVLHPEFVVLHTIPICPSMDLGI